MDRQTKPLLVSPLYQLLGASIRYLLLAAIFLLPLILGWFSPSSYREAPLKLAISHSFKNGGDVRLITERSEYMRSER
jgi:hypothetical protein